MEAFLAFVIAQKQPLICFAICLSVPSILLYCMEIVTIFRHKSFHTSFHALFIIRAVPDLLYTLDSYYGYRLPNLFGRFLYPIYSQLPNWLLSLFAFLTSYTFQADNLATGFILLHRLTAIGLPMQHEKIWSKLVPLAALISLGGPLYCAQLFSMQSSIMLIEGNRSSGNDAYFIIAEAENSNMLLPKYMKINAGIAVLFLLVCVLINIGTLVAYRRRQRYQQQQQNAESETIQRKLLIYSLTTFFGHVLVALLMLSFALFSALEDSTTLLLVVNTQYPWIVDMCTVVLPSWLLLWASQNFRHQLLVDFMPKWMCGGSLAMKGSRFRGIIKVIPYQQEENATKKQNSWTGGIK